VGQDSDKSGTSRASTQDGGSRVWVTHDRAKKWEQRGKGEIKHVRNKTLSSPDADEVVSLANGVLVDALAVLQKFVEVTPHGDAWIVALVDIDHMTSRCK
jgi:hypothetical protein